MKIQNFMHLSCLIYDTMHLMLQSMQSSFTFLFFKQQLPECLLLLVTDFIPLWISLKLFGFFPYSENYTHTHTATHTHTSHLPYLVQILYFVYMNLENISLWDKRLTGNWNWPFRMECFLGLTRYFYTLSLVDLREVCILLVENVLVAALSHESSNTSPQTVP